MRNQLLEWGPRIRRAILLALLGGVPIFFLRTGLDPFNVPKLALLIVGVSLAGLIRGAEALQGVRFRTEPAVWVPGAALLFALGVAWIFSPYKGWALLGHFGRFQGLVPYGLVVLLSLLIYDSFRDDVRPILWTLVGAGGVVSAYALIQTIGADPFAWSAFGAPTRAISTLGNPNFTGGFLGMTLPLCLGLWIDDRARGRLALRLGVLIAAGWIAAGSEGGWAGGIAGCAVFGGIYLSARGRVWRLAGLATAAAVALGVVVAGLLGASRNVPLVPHTLELRGGWWVSAGRMAMDHPFFGRGPNAYAVEGVQYRTERDAEELGYNFTDDPHSVPMAWLAAAGLLGGLAYVVLAGSTARLGSSIPSANVLAASACGGLVAYFVQSLASIDELSLRVAAWGLLPALALSLHAERPRARDKQDGKKSKPKRRVKRADVPLRHAWAVPLLAFAGIAAVALAGMILVADRRMQQVVSVTSRDPSKGTAAYQTAIRLRDDPYYRYLYGLEIGNAAVEEGNSGGSLLDASEEAFAYLDDFPDVRGLVGYGRILYEWSDQTGADRESDALALLQRAMNLDPLNPAIRVETSDILVEIDRLDDALSVLQPAVRVVGTDSHPEVWGAVAVVHAHMGSVLEAEEAIAVARSLNPDDARAAKAAELLEKP